MDVESPAQGKSAGGRAGLGHRVTSAITASFAVFVVARLLQVLFLAVLARLLSPADFGIAAGATVFLSVVSILFQMGVGTAIVQSETLADRTVGVANTIVLATAVVAFLFIEFSAPWVAEWFHNDAMAPVVRIIALASLAYALAAIPQGLMTRDLRARDLSVIELVSAVVGTATVAIPMAWLGQGYWALVVGLIVQSFTKAALVIPACRTPFSFALDSREAGRLWARGGGFSLDLILIRIATQCDRFIVGRYLPTGELGLYSRATSLMGFPEVIYGQVIERVAFPAFAELQNERDRLRTAYVHGLSLMAVLGIPMTIFLVAVASELVRVVLGDGWQGTIWPFRILALAMYFRLSVRVGGTVLRSGGQPYLMAVTQLIFATLTVVGCLSAWRFGLAGICAAVVGATTANYALVTMFACRRTGLGFLEFVRVQTSGVACGLLAVAVVLPTLLVARHLELNAFGVVFSVTVMSLFAAVGAVALAPRLFLGQAGSLVLNNLIDIATRSGAVPGLERYKAQ
ncbi:MAG: lipopolysaccharide biosynthesis protein [Caulobacterales bacterium]|nr:lipopolysaccharide biosynthesis protein [Caulobacterales bacterium]